jgi:hypothetical protein
VTDPRNPPVSVWVDRPLEEAVWPGLLYGWAPNPRGGESSLRGLVVAERTGGGEYVGWVLPVHLRLR